MQILLLIVLTLTAVHLFVKHDTRITKPLLLPAIIAYYCVAAKQPDVLLILAFVFSWLGDVLLMPHGDRWFTAGGIAFAVSHFLFIAAYSSRAVFAPVSCMCGAAALVLYGSCAAFVIRNIRAQTPGWMVVPMYIYLLANSAMNVFALMRLVAPGGAGALTAYLGAVLFFVSDCSLFLARNGKKYIPNSHLLIMGTYVLGELFIAHGMAFL